MISLAEVTRYIDATYTEQFVRIYI